MGMEGSWTRIRQGKKSLAGRLSRVAEGGRGRRAPGGRRECARSGVCVCGARRARAPGGLPVPPPPGGPGRRGDGAGGGSWWGWRVRVSARVSVRARAAGNQEVTAAQRTQTCLIAVTGRARGRKRRRAPGGGPSAPAGTLAAGGGRRAQRPFLFRVLQVRSLRRLRRPGTAFQHFPRWLALASRLAFPAKSGRLGVGWEDTGSVPSCRSLAWKTFQREASRGGRRRPRRLLSLVSVLLRVRGVESQRPGAVAHSNFGPKRASNSCRICSSNK